MPHYITLTEAILFTIFYIAIGCVFVWLSNRRPNWDAPRSMVGALDNVSTGYRWLRKSALPVLVALFMVIYPFTQPFARFITNLIYGVSGTAHAGNATGAEIIADQMSGGGVQVGTFITKVWITIFLFLLAKWLPWQAQKLTHPGPTEWAQTDYKTDFKALPATHKFKVYGWLQKVDTWKFIGAGLIAALLV